MKKLGVVVGFIPWIVFSTLYSSNSTAIIEACLSAIVISMIVSHRELRKGFIFPWGSLICFMALAINGYFNISEWLINHPNIPLNCTIPLIIWVSLVIGKPFTLQYAKEQVPPEKWNSPLFIKINNILTVMWGVCLSIAAVPSLFMDYNTYHHSIWWNTIFYYLCLAIAIWLNRKLPSLIKKSNQEAQSA